MDTDVQGRLDVVRADLLRLRLELKQIIAENEELIAQAQRLANETRDRAAPPPWPENKPHSPLPGA